MVMESPSPQCVGREFVRQYYTVLNKAPLYLHRFYSDNSSFIHGGLDQPGEETEPAIGQQKIHEKIVLLNFCDCHAKIRQVDSLATLDNGIVVQVTGELSNNRQPMRRFMQTFVLVPQSPKNYYVRNDIFRYQDEVFNDDEDADNQEVVGDSYDQNEQDVPKKIADSPYYEPEVIRNGTSHVNSTDLVTPTTPVITQDLHHENDSPKSDWDSADEDDEDEEDDEVDDEEDDEKGDPDDPLVITQNTNEPKTYANMVSKNAMGIGFTVSTTGPVATPPAFSSVNQNKIIETTPVFIKPEPNNTTAVNTTPSTSPGGNTNYQSNMYQRPRGGGGLRFGNMHNSGRRNDSRDFSGSFTSFNNRMDETEEKRKTHYPDSQQLFVGNLPHDIGEGELKEIFTKFGSVIDMRINTKQNHTKLGGGGKGNVPNFGFVVFNDEEAVQKALSERPVFYNQHRLNVEEKKTKMKDTRGIGDGRLGSGRGGTIGRGGGGYMGSNRGRGGMSGMNRLDNRGRGGMYNRR